jgi:hypothetical protein
MKVNFGARWRWVACFTSQPLIPGEGDPCTHWIGDQVSPGCDLDSMQKKFYKETKETKFRSTSMSLSHYPHVGYVLSAWTKKIKMPRTSDRSVEGMLPYNGSRPSASGETIVRYGNVLDSHSLQYKVGPNESRHEWNCLIFLGAIYFSCVKQRAKYVKLPGGLRHVIT